MKKNNIKTLLLLHILLLLYSLSAVCTKSASAQTFMSWGFILFYAGTIALLGIYALGWQQVIKHLPLTTAFANKAITTVWGLVWGYFIFHEQITIGKICGVVLVVAGVILYSLADRENITGAADTEAGAAGSEAHDE